MTTKQQYSVKTKLILLLGIVIVSVILMTIYLFTTIEKQKYDALQINMAGRQRLLTQKILKETMFLDHNATSKDQIFSSIAMFESSQSCLLNGGHIAINLQMTDYATLPILDDKIAIKQLKKVKNLWLDEKKVLIAYINSETKDNADLFNIISKNIVLLHNMDIAVELLQKHSESKTNYIKVFFIIVSSIIILLLILIFLLIRKYITKPLEEDKDRAEKANQSKDKLFATVSHDMRNITSLQLSYSELLTNNLDTMDNDSLRNFIKEMYNVSKSSSELLENLLYWSRSQMNKIELQPENAILFDIVYSTLSILEHNASNKEIKLINKIPNDILIYADIDIIKLVIRNLTSNSIKFSPSNSIIIAEAYIDNGIVYCSISDDGVGISKENIEKILDTENYYSTAGTNAEKGTGFGLNMCINFIKLHKGGFSIESNEGIGSKFTFSIPVKTL